MSRLTPEDWSDGDEEEFNEETRMTEEQNDDDDLDITQPSEGLYYFIKIFNPSRTFELAVIIPDAFYGNSARNIAENALLKITYKEKDYRLSERESGKYIFPPGVRVFEEKGRFDSLPDDEKTLNVIRTNYDEEMVNDYVRGNIIKEVTTSLFGKRHMIPLILHDLAVFLKVGDPPLAPLVYPRFNFKPLSMTHSYEFPYILEIDNPKRYMRMIWENAIYFLGFEL